MGVSGLWDIISPAERKYSLEELALHHTEHHNSCLRVAIDISIWNVQARSTQGGTNPFLRTFFYRCCRLYALGIRPVFVFDGDQRPAYKRNQHINTSVSNSVEHYLLLALVKLFGFAVWNAAGEAEAECAVLQRLGYVDIVFTTDVDVFLFGGQRVARNWPGTDYEPIQCVDSKWIEETTFLDRSDMILMALLSGSDYDSGVNKLGIQVSLALAKLKYHRSVLNTLQAATDTSTCDKSTQSKSHDNDTLYSTQLHEMGDKLQHELNTNQSGFLRRRHHTIDLKPLVENERFTKLAKDWIYPNTAILNPSNTEAAKKLYTLLNDPSVTPEFVSLATFCQTQFDWSKATTMDKFAKKLYPGYMLHRTTTWNDTNPAIGTGTSTTKLHQQPARRQRMHPYFNKHYRNRDLFYSNENQLQQQPMDLSRIHLIEDLRKTKHGIRSQKLSRCRVSWHRQSLVDFLSRLETELVDGIGTDTNQATTNFDSQTDDHATNSQENTCNNRGDRQTANIDLFKDYDNDNDDCIDLTIPQLPPAPAVAAPSLTVPGIQSDAQTQSSTLLPPTTTTKENDDSWILQYCDPNICCRQWIGSHLVQRVYPKMMNEFTKSQQAKKKQTNTTTDPNQKQLDSFFTPIHDTPSTLSNGVDLSKNKISTSTNTQYTSAATTTTTSNPHHGIGQSLILPLRKKRTVE